jgi:hypothetical protein
MSLRGGCSEELASQRGVIELSQDFSPGKDNSRLPSLDVSGEATLDDEARDSDQEEDPEADALLADVRQPLLPPKRRHGLLQALLVMLVLVCSASAGAWGAVLWPPSLVTALGGSPVYTNLPAAWAALRQGHVAGAWRAWVSGAVLQVYQVPEQPESARILAPRGVPLPERVCNITAPVPELRSNPWDIGPTWRRVCEQKNHHVLYPYERNWCWIGMKAKCHGNLKAHHSWTVLQQMGAEQGSVPPVELAPFSPLQHPEVCDRPYLGKSAGWSAEDNRTAREWFRNHVAVYVLNLPSDEQRWRMINKRLDSLGIWATRVPGVDMREEGALDSAKRQGWVPENFNFSLAQATAYTYKHQMGSILGTLGCASAHFKVQTKVLADGMPLAVVLEDDSWPEEDFVQRLWSLVTRELPCDWEVTALMSRCPYGTCISPHLLRVQPDINEPAWRCRHGVNWGMQGTLYRTGVLQRLQVLWKRTVFDEARPHCMDVDVALASISDQVGFYAVPSVQDPGFLYETNHPSARWGINQAARTTSTVTTTRFDAVAMKPGEPWPGTWSFG